MVRRNKNYSKRRLNSKTRNKRVKRKNSRTNSRTKRNFKNKRISRTKRKNRKSRVQIGAAQRGRFHLDRDYPDRIRHLDILRADMERAYKNGEITKKDLEQFMVQYELGKRGFANTEKMHTKWKKLDAKGKMPEAETSADLTYVDTGLSRPEEGAQSRHVTFAPSATEQVFDADIDAASGILSLKPAEEAMASVSPDPLAPRPTREPDQEGAQGDAAVEPTSVDTGLQIDAPSISLEPRQLPAGWNEGRSRRSGDTYYLNTRTQKTQYNWPELPAGWNEGRSRQTGDTYYLNTRTQKTQYNWPELPAVWEEHRSRSTDEKYYLNTVTGKSQYELPI